ncbi:MAG: BON domain-containing protein [Rhodobacteraceae bacterium]|nr:BON domain-containing protein [Paracoccaceae bacterium]
MPTLSRPSDSKVLTAEELATRIRTTFVEDDRLSAQPIEIVVKQGVVTLRGTVQSYRRKLAAQEIASSIDGCRDLINELIVDPPGPVTDQDIAAFVRQSLAAHADISKKTILVTVKDGFVTLAGNVSSHWEQAAADDVARGARGVRDVLNLLNLDVKREVEDKTLSESIMVALTMTRGLSWGGIRVAVSGGSVVLSGSVGALSDKQMAESVARRFRPLQVRNDIIVNASSSAG